MAYCLLGILGVNMPLLYGEGANAFVRLQEEVIRNSADQSILLWSLNSSGLGHLASCMTSILASSPAAFAECSNIDTALEAGDDAYAMTNLGLNMKLPLKLVSTGPTWAYAALLEDGRKKDIRKVLFLRHLYANRYARVHHIREADLEHFTTMPMSFGKPQTINIVQRFESSMITDVADAFGILLRTSFATRTGPLFSSTVHLFCADHRRRSLVINEVAENRENLSSRIAPFPNPVPRDHTTWVAMALIHHKVSDRPKNIVLLEFGVDIHNHDKNHKYDDGYGDKDSEDNARYQRSWVRWSAQSGQDVLLGAPRSLSIPTVYHTITELPQLPYDSMVVIDSSWPLPEGKRCQLSLNDEELYFCHSSHKSWPSGRMIPGYLRLKVRPELIDGRLFVAVDINTEQY